MTGLYAHDHLLATQQRIADELARAQGHLAFRHDGGGVCVDGGSGRWSVWWEVSARLSTFDVVDRALQWGEIREVDGCCREDLALTASGFSGTSPRPSDGLTRRRESTFEFVLHYLISDLHNRNDGAHSANNRPF